MLARLLSEYDEREVAKAPGTPQSLGTMPGWCPTVYERPFAPQSGSQAPPAQHQISRSERSPSSKLGRCLAHGPTNTAHQAERRSGLIWSRWKHAHFPSLGRERCKSVTISIRRISLYGRLPPFVLVCGAKRLDQKHHLPDLGSAQEKVRLFVEGGQIPFLSSELGSASASRTRCGARKYARIRKPGEAREVETPESTHP